MAVSCNKPAQNQGQEQDVDLDAPKEVKIIELTDHSVTIEWQAVQNATGYRWNCDASDQFIGGVSSDCHISSDVLRPGTTYHFQVRAEDNTRNCPDEIIPYPLFSDWTELDFTTPDISGK